MAKKKEKTQTINNIQNLNVEIDYDKLAESIVKAQEKVEETAHKKRRYTLGTFATPLIVAFYSLSVLGWLLVVAVPVSVYKSWQTLHWDNFLNCFGSAVSLLFLFGITVIVALYSILLWKSAKEVEAETDRNYIVSMFSGVVSFAALIVALVALVKG